MRILLIQSDGVAEPLLKMLRYGGAEVVLERSLEEGHARSLSEWFDVVLVVHTTDSEDLLQRYQNWRLRGCTSCYAVLTRRASGRERALALAAGIEHYFIEPCSYRQIMQELMQAIRPTRLLQWADLVLDESSAIVWRAGRDCQLSPTEFALLRCFMKRPGTILSRLQLWEEVWGWGGYPADNTVDVHMYRLRRKLGDPEGLLIRTVHGIGYRLGAAAVPAARSGKSTAAR